MNPVFQLQDPVALPAASSASQPAARHGWQTGTLRLVRPVPRITPVSNSVDIVLPHATQAATRVLFSFAFSPAMTRRCYQRSGGRCKRLTE